ncbi:MAG: lasso peptide biosynthesis B2 protein [Vicinamibacterales bacterium]
MLLLEAALLLALIRLGLFTLSFASLRGLLAKWPRTRPTTGNLAAIADRMVWAVETASRRFPAIGTCLTQALAVHVLLAGRSIHSDLRIGVTRTPNGKFIAHAWLERDGRILIGEADHKHYSPMPILNIVKP